MRNKLYLTFILIGIYILLSFNSFAAKVFGVVRDEKNEPLIGAVVVLKGLEKGTQTDIDGRYEFDNVEDGTYEIVFSMVTYKKVLKTITVLKGKDVELDAVLKEEGNNKLTEVTVKATKVTNTENAVLMEVRKSNTIVSGISAQQIAKTMDRNAADVVKRVPGVTIRDDKFIMVRGLYDRYNNVWLNDAGAPSSEVDIKSFSFDAIPSGQIDRMLVYKTPAPDLPGDFAGGMVKLYTTSIPAKNTYSLGFSTSSREYSTGTQFNYNEPSKTDWLGFDDGKRELPSLIADKERISKNDPDNAEVTKSLNNNWQYKTKTLAPDMRFNLSASNVFKINKVRLGNTFAVNYSNTSTNYSITRKDWDSTDIMYIYQDKASVNNVNVALMDNLAMAWGNNKIEFKNLYNQAGSSSFTYRVNLPDTTKEEAYERTFNMGYESRASYNTQLTGSHKSSNDARKYCWTLGYTDLFKNMPDLRRIRYSKTYGQDDSMYSAPISFGSTDPVYGGGRVFSQLYEKVYSFNHQYSHLLPFKNLNLEVSAGNYIELKKRAYKLRQLGYSIKPGVIANKLKRLDVNQIFSEENLATATTFKLDEDTRPYDWYDASNTLIASFLAAKWVTAREKLTLYGGVRYEYNKYTLVAAQNLNILNPQVVTKFWLPSLNVSYNLNEKSLVRLAYGKTLNRPEFRENSPFYFYDLENRWGIKGAMFPTKINPKGDTLDVAQIHNIDARWEFYPAPGEVVQAGLFYKNIKSPIQQIISVPAGDAREFTFANLKSGYTYGLEIEARKSLAFLDNALSTKNIFRDLAITGNMALIKSEVTPDTNVKNIKTPLQGQSPYMYNAGLYYQNDSIGLQISALYNVFGPRIAILGTTDDGVGNIWEMPFNSFDVILSKKFFKYITLTAGVQNLLNQKVRQVQDVNYDNKIQKDYNDVNSIDKSIMEYRPGRYFTIGLKMKL